MEGVFRISHGIPELSWEETSGRRVATGRGVVVVGRVEGRLVVGLAVVVRALGSLVVVVGRTVLGGALVVEERLVGRTVLDGTRVVGRFVVAVGRFVVVIGRFGVVVGRFVVVIGRAVVDGDWVEDRLVVGRAVVEETRGAGFLVVFLIDGARVVVGRFVTGFWVVVAADLALDGLRVSSFGERVVG